MQLEPQEYAMRPSDILYLRGGDLIYEEHIECWCGYNHKDHWIECSNCEEESSWQRLITKTEGEVS